MEAQPLGKGAEGRGGEGAPTPPPLNPQCQGQSPGTSP